jgi:hypothetical protein
MLHRAAVRDRQVAAIFGELRSGIKQGLERFNIGRSADPATVPLDLSGELVVDFQGKRIFIARIMEGMATQIQFCRDAKDKPPEWFTISLNQKEEILIADRNGAAVANAEELTERALAFMFAPYSV